ncbi:MAG: hypothetical protein IJ064_03420 [Bacteroidaceae bacterium]|nr:hypothetical protein [Bacteroidaceae bacterium]
MEQDRMAETVTDLARLRKAVEQELGQRLLNPKDFVYLSECIGERTHQHIGVNTLKRIWGQLDDHVTPRLSTLNLLAQFVGADSWEAFRQPLRPADETLAPAQPGDAGVETALPRSTAAEASLSVRRPRFLLWVVPVLALLSLAAIGGVHYYRVHTAHIAQLEDSLQRASARHYLLRCGQRFASYDDYLQLFGLVDVREFPYFQIHPQHPHLVLWGPEYHHPHWHNDGDASQMMPTITERWEPADTLPELVALQNSELYYNGRRNRDIRLTFMKGLDGDTSFVFLGVYRFSLTQSDTTHIVWERVADEADLLHLEALERFRE